MWGKTWFVSPTFTGPTQNGSATCPFLTAQAAVDAAGDGDAIVLGVGNAGAVDVGNKSISFFGVAATLDGNVSTLDAVTATGDPARIAFTNMVVLSVVAPNTVATFDTSFVLGQTEVSGFTAHQSTFLLNSDTDAFVVTTFASSFTDCTFLRSGEGNVTLTPGTFGVSFDLVSAQSFQNGQWLYDVPSSVSALPADLEPNLFYGDGSDGSLAAGFGALTLTRDMYFQNVAFQAGDSIRTSQWRVYIAGVLDLRGAPAAAIDLSFDSSTTGIDGSGSTGGTAPAIVSNGSLTQGSAGGAGGTGGNATAAGTSGGAGGNSAFGTLGGTTGTGGKGGAGTGGGAGAGGAAGTYSKSSVDVRNPRTGQPYLRPFSITARATETGSGGGGGGGGATGKGGGGGAAPRGSSAGEVFARCVIRDGTTDAAAIQGTGPRGGNGADGTTDGGGGGGAGAAGGSPLLLVLDWLIGEFANFITLTGGAGGNGGNGAGGAAGGTGGTGADSGTLTLGQRIRNQWTFLVRVAGAAGNAPSGSTGGTGGAGGVRVTGA